MSILESEDELKSFCIPAKHSLEEYVEDIVVGSGTFGYIVFQFIYLVI